MEPIFISCNSENRKILQESGFKPRGMEPKSSYYDNKNYGWLQIDDITKKEFIWSWQSSYNILSIEVFLEKYRGSISMSKLNLI